MNIKILYRPAVSICSFLASLLPGALTPCAAFAQEEGGSVHLVFHMQQSREIYDNSSYGEPPQFAIWVEDSASGEIKTLHVTRRTATGRYIGKVECPVSLPIWIGAFRKETGRNDFPTPKQPFFDTVTGATPQIADIIITTDVEAGRCCHYYIEMNVAGDYNRAFPKVSAKKRQDNHGNGQPSLVYKGTIQTNVGTVSKPECAGRSQQYFFVTEIDSDLAGIDSALEVFRIVSVECKPAR
jgi:hypothetical protein